MSERIQNGWIRSLFVRIPLDILLLYCYCDRKAIATVTREMYRSPTINGQKGTVSLMYPDNYSPYPPAPPYVAAPPPPPIGKRRSVGGAVLLETLIPGAGFVYAGRVDVGILVFVLSFLWLGTVFLLLLPAFIQTAGGIVIIGINLMSFPPDLTSFDIADGAIASIFLYCAARFIGAARAVFVRNIRVAGSSRPLAGLATLISVLSAISVTVGAGLYFSFQQTCLGDLSSDCASPVYPYRSLGEVLLIGGAVGLLIGLIG